LPALKISGSKGLKGFEELEDFKTPKAMGFEEKAGRPDFGLAF
jgi:hypothetical protein